MARREDEDLCVQVPKLVAHLPQHLYERGQARCATEGTELTAQNIQLQSIAAGKLSRADCPRQNKRDSEQDRAPPTRQWQ
eukprot:8952993-Pyramimonas_sp.AAC.1